jgi:hypothetical protein
VSLKFWLMMQVRSPLSAQETLLVSMGHSSRGAPRGGRGVPTKDMMRGPAGAHRGSRAKNAGRKLMTKSPIPVGSCIAEC